MSNIFITGIGTDVGKTVVAAIVTQALQADYWKPIQSGLEEMDKATIASLINNSKTQIHPEAYRLYTPMSPHKAAEIDGITIDLAKIIRPKTENTLVIEGAGGLLVPINDQATIVDLISPEDQVILVSSGYLGSINHTLLSVALLKAKGLNCVGIIYNHVDLDGTIEVIEKMTGLTTLGHITREQEISAAVVSAYALKFEKVLKAL
ncbi:dethiobiotin synthase [Nonlabens sp.]|uniref:dethiobiotin synthase n=1 Tax=Nonlabens sp. TaxID=1888209 RepID=UPI001BCA848E|nr:dethiobiotin synthase [Nonlabens sp.]